MTNPAFISRYRVLEEVGRGGMGVVYKAEDPRLERLVAVKTLPQKLLRNKEALRRFLREAKVAAKLDHPNIVPIYDVGEDNGVYFMVMEFLEGTTLREWLEARETIDVSKAMQLFQQIARAVEYAHQRKVIHRDIKPDNIMLVHKDTIKVMDFGIAVMDDRHSVTQPGAVLGTIAYLSPEQAKGKPADVRSDIYSLGVMGYELLTGDLPFEAQTASEMLSHHLSTMPLPPSSSNPNVPKKLDNLVLKALQKNPEARYQSVMSLLEDLESLVPRESMEEKFITSPAEKEVLESVESFLSLGPAFPPGPDMDKTKIMEGLKALLSQPFTGKQIEERAEQPQELSRDSFVKYRLVVERIQKDLAAMREEMVKSPQDAIEIREKEKQETGQIPCSRCGALHPTGEKHCPACGVSLLQATVSVSSGAIAPGVEFYESGKFKEAIVFFSELLKKEPRIAEAYLYLGLSYFQLKQFREALSCFRKGTELEPNHGMMWQGLGDAACELSHDLEALQAYEQAARFIPSPRLWLKLAGIEEGLGHLEKARRALSKALELDPQDEDAQKAMVQILIRLSRFQDALQWVRKILEKRPKDTVCLRLLGFIYENTDRYSQALQTYEKALSIDPRDTRVLAQLGELHDKQNRPDLALANFSKAAELEPQSPGIYAKLAHLHLKRDENEAALGYFEKASTLNPNDSAIHKELGKIYFKKNDLDQAMVQFEWTIALDPSDPEAHGQLGLIYYRKDQSQLSIREYKSAIQLEPYNPEFHENLGLVYYVEEDFEQAIEELKRAVILDSGNIDYRKALGVIYEAKGKLDLARREYQKAVEAIPKDYLAQGLLGRVYLEQELVHLAIFQFQKALNLEPRSHLMQSLLGKAYLRLAQFDRAAESFQKAIENAPQPDTPRGKQITGKTYFYLGQCLLESGDAKGAESALRQSTTLLPTHAKAFHLLGKAQNLSGNLEAARKNLEHAARLSPEESEIFFDLAQMAAQGEDYTGAVRALEKAIQLDPERASYYGFLGDILGMGGNLEQAILAYNQALRWERSKKGPYYSKLGTLFMKKSDPAAAVTQFKSAVEASPENWHYHQDLAKAYKATGNIEEAVLELERAKSKSLDSDVLSSIEEEIGRLKKKR